MNIVKWSSLVKKLLLTYALLQSIAWFLYNISTEWVKRHREEVTFLPEWLHSFWLMAVPEGQRDQRPIKKLSFLSYDSWENRIFLENVHNHASFVYTRLRRWVERSTISILQRSLVTCSESTQCVRRWVSLVAPPTSSYFHAHLSSTNPPPWRTSAPTLAFRGHPPSFPSASFLGLPWVPGSDCSFFWSFSSLPNPSLHAASLLRGSMN